METVLGICLGLGLAAACGFRVFVPLFLMSLAAKTGFIELADNFGWISSWPAFTAFATATVLETAAYYIPWFDNLLDAVATPAAVVAGVIATAASIVDADPFIQWSAAIIGGAGVAGTVQTSFVATRSASTIITGGLGNFVLATFEWVGAFFMSIVAVLAPIFAALVALGLTAAALSMLFRRVDRPASGGGT